MRKRYCQIAALMVMTVAGLLPASAAPFPATVSGVVRDGRGTPQMGAMVELLAADATVIARVFTNDSGRLYLRSRFPRNLPDKGDRRLLPSYLA